MSFSCTRCGKQFKTKKGYVHHDVYVNCGEIHKCDVCNRDFPYASKLRDHKCIGIHEYKCPHCDKILEGIKVYTEHERMYIELKLTKVIAKLQEEPKIINNNITNNNTVNIQINNIGNIKHDHLDIYSMLRDPNPYKSVIEALYCNVDVPENMCVYIPSATHGIMYVRENGKWNSYTNAEAEKQLIGVSTKTKDVVYESTGWREVLRDATESQQNEYDLILRVKHEDRVPEIRNILLTNKELLKRFIKNSSEPPAIK